MKFDRAAILRSAHAHAHARQRLATNRAWRTYREAFADALRREWRLAKDARNQAEFEAEEAIELPADVQERAAALRLYASCLSFGCTKSYRELNDEAASIESAARAAMALSQRGSFHVVR